MGQPVTAPAPAAVPEVLRQQAELEAAIAPKLGAKGKAAFTLRLDPARHLRLRMACAAKGKSAQVVVTQALDAYLDSIPELDTLVGQAASKRPL
jgi:predicted HicB family RNase H-like nuclease